MQICSGGADPCGSISRCCVFGSVRINLVFTLQFDQRWNFIMDSSCVALNSGFIASHFVQNTHGYHVAATSSHCLLFFVLIAPEQSLRSCCHHQLMSSSGDSNIFSFPVMDTYDDAWTWWIVGLFGCPASCCMSCVRAPWTWGLFVCFCALFSPLNVEGVYNELSLCLNCNSFGV